MATFLTAEQIKNARQQIAMADQLEGFVPGEGSLTPKFTIVSEAPGRVEAETGHGFMGPSGQMLNAWLAELGISRDDIYMTGAVRARPFSVKDGRKRDRKPTSKEGMAFAPLLDSELKSLPTTNDLLVPLGNTGLQRLLGSAFKVGEYHGSLLTRPIQYLAGDHYEWTIREYRIFPMFHPSYARRFPSKRPVAAADLQVLKTLL